MLDSHRLYKALEQSVNEFADRMVEVMLQASTQIPDLTGKQPSSPQVHSSKPAVTSNKTAIQRGTSKTAELSTSQADMTKTPSTTEPLATTVPLSPAVNKAKAISSQQLTAAPAFHRITTSPLGKQMLGLVSQYPNGISANDIADRLQTGLVPVFEGLRDLEAAGLLVRVVRDPDQLPVYAPV